MAKQVKKLNQKPKPLTSKLRVAAYVRVSMQSEDLLRSYARQVDYYTKLITNNPEWELAGIFADRGITGTNAEKRDGFLEMLSECEKGNINIILTKSISRFSRNTLDLLNTVRHLKELGVEVRFEKENINSLSGDGELMLTILASFAQEESRSISENVKWGIRKRNEKGMNASGMRRFFGYEPVDGEYRVVEEEAVIVRRIFAMFNAGMEVTEICRTLNAEGLKTHKGREFLGVNVAYLLQNEMYIGDRLTNKFYVENNLTHRLVRNHGEVEQFYIEGDHMPIIEREDFERAQQRFAAKQREKIVKLPYHGIIVCGYCGSAMF
ncbi:MAG TPA: recombinase family protein, partial [Ruminococcus sp.]|nr:recombinase family protein [Ruminococcus sp.]